MKNSNSLRPDALQLNSHQLGEGPPLVILHGLFGNWENWASRMNAYACDFSVCGIDLRNHGDSPHSDDMDYRLMAADVQHTLHQLGIEQCALMGHSMGGKVAMQLACNQPSLVNQLVIVDIAPKLYKASHTQLLDALLAMDPATINRRSMADQVLAGIEPDKQVRAFLLKNLQRSDKGFRWKINVAAIAENYHNLLLPPDLRQPFGGSTLFIKGAESDYLTANDADLVQKWFPKTQFKLIDGAGHWPHAAKPVVFDHVLRRFLV